MEHTNICAVIIPVYKSLDEMERKVLRQLNKMTLGFRKVFVAPQDFIFDSSFNEFDSYAVEYFLSDYFRSIEGYNKLMLSEEFYTRFLDYEYILIHQTDAYLFKDELSYWCQTGYSYIGAPWYFPELTWKDMMIIYVKTRIMYFHYADEHLRDILHYNKVGNGGLSLRNVNTFLRVLQKSKPQKINKYRNNTHYVYNEDVFWGIEAPNILKEYRLPTLKEAMRFSLELHAEKASQIIGGLPFGCHAFQKHSVDFWEKIIPFLNEYE